MDTLVVQTKPEPFYTADSYVHLLVPEGQGLPYMVFQVPKFGRRGFDLKASPERFSIDDYNKTITIIDPIVILRQAETDAGVIQ